MGQETFETSNSKQGLWLKCRHAYHLRHRLHLVPRIEAPQLRIGTLCHAGMRAGLLAQYGGQTMPDAISSRIFNMWEEWAENPQIKPLLEDPAGTAWEDSVDMRNDCTSIVLRAFERLGIFAGRWETQTLEGKPLIEYELETTEDSDARWHGAKRVKRTGTLDWVARDTETGHVWLIDHKFRKALIDDDEYDDPNSQAAGYQYLLGQRGLVLNGTATAQIRAAVPKVPTVNKGKGAHQGKMTRSPRSTDWHTYRQACLDAGLDPADYGDVEVRLKPFERLTFNYRSPMEVMKMWEESRSIAAAMAETEDDKPYRSMSPHKCRGCEYREPCLEELRGGDVDVLLKTLFMHVRDQPASWAYHPPEQVEGGDEDDADNNA